MKITIESTTQTVFLNGVECRVWEGTTERGIALTAFIPRVAVKNDLDCAEFERDLVAKGPAKIASDVWPLRMVL